MNTFSSAWATSLRVTKLDSNSCCALSGVGRVEGHQGAPSLKPVTVYLSSWDLWSNSGQVTPLVRACVILLALCVLFPSLWTSHFWVIPFVLTSPLFREAAVWVHSTCKWCHSLWSASPPCPAHVSVPETLLLTSSDWDLSVYPFFDSNSICWFSCMYVCVRTGYTRLCIRFRLGPWVWFLCLAHLHTAGAYHGACSMTGAQGTSASLLNE